MTIPQEPPSPEQPFPDDPDGPEGPEGPESIKPSRVFTLYIKADESAPTLSAHPSLGSDNAL
jgi:hypothetical protein